jgi:PAS domain S-box-containing protein
VGDRYRQLFENAPIGIINVDLAGKPLMVNRRAATTLGYASPEEFMREVPSMLELWADLGARHRAAEILLASGTLVDFPVVMKRRDGSWITLSVSANPVHDSDGTVSGLQVGGIDITDRIEAEARLTQAQAQAAIGFWSWRIDTDVFSGTKGVSLLFGLDDGEGIGSFSRIRELIHPDDREIFEMRLATFKHRPGESLELEFRVVIPDGETKWLIARGSVEGDGLRVSGSVQDITKQKIVEEKLKELNDLKTEFVGVVAHDLRTPLTVAIGYTEYLRDQWDVMVDTERRKLVDNVQRSLDRLGSLVSSVLELTRLEGGSSPSDARPFDLGELVDSVVGDIRSTVYPRRCGVEIRDPLPIVIADRDAMERVVTNLVSNALKYSDPSEPVMVEVDRWGSDMRVAVRDRGRGIAPADQGKLFQRFSRLPASGGPRPEGSGLGLYICRSLVEEWGGSIWVESVVGQGSTFAFTVPAVPEARAM